jgi:hypothetical protein
MKTFVTSVIVAAATLFAAATFAQAPVGAPAGATGMCKDGSYWTGATKQGACHGHQGVKAWYAAAPAAAAGAAATAAPAMPAAAPAPASPAIAPAHTQPATPTPAATAAPGGGPGQVWVNSSSKVYHCPTDKWYGKTKSGEYMAERDAVAKGYHADHGKACT